MRSTAGIFVISGIIGLDKIIKAYTKIKFSYHPNSRLLKITHHKPTIYLGMVGEVQVGRNLKEFFTRLGPGNKFHERRGGGVLKIACHGHSLPSLDLF